jgi:hypothetical protein
MKTDEVRHKTNFYLDNNKNILKVKIVEKNPVEIEMKFDTKLQSQYLSDCTLENQG